MWTNLNCLFAEKCKTICMRTSLQWLYVENLTLFMCGPTSIVYLLTRLKCLYVQRFTILYVVHFSLFICGQIYTVYVWSSSHYFYVEQFTMFNPFPSLTLQSARDLNVPCPSKRPKALFLRFSWFYCVVWSK